MPEVPSALITLVVLKLMCVAAVFRLPEFRLTTTVEEPDSCTARRDMMDDLGRRPVG
jgi:hypothetical protein